MGSCAAQRTRRVVAAGLLAASLVAAGCSAADAPPSSPAPTVAGASVAVPADGVSLAQLGFRHGPAGLIVLPNGVRLTQQVDQPNHVTAGFTAPDGADITPWLASQLSGAGFTITGQGSAALLFTGHGWSGAYTSGGGESALTLRRDPA